MPPFNKEMPSATITSSSFRILYLVCRVLPRSFQSKWLIIFTSSLCLKDFHLEGCSFCAHRLLLILWKLKSALSRYDSPVIPLYILHSVQVSLQRTHPGPSAGPPVPARCLLYPAVLQGPAANVSREVCELKLKSVYQHFWPSWSLLNSYVESTQDLAGDLHWQRLLVLTGLRSFV